LIKGSAFEGKVSGTWGEVLTKRQSQLWVECLPRKV